MKLVLLLILLSLSSYTFAQKDSIIVKGIVSNTESKRVKNAFIHLVSSVGHRYQCITDSTGNYQFHFYSESPFSCTVTIASDKRTTTGKFRNPGFLASKDNAIFELIPGKTFVKDFTLPEINSCEIFIRLLFKHNSIISCNDSLNKIDSLNYKNLDYEITGLLYLMKDDPGMIIELQGHASSIEKNSNQLSLYRAQAIREILIEKGINGNRLMTKGWGNSKLLIKDDVIKKAKTKEEKAALHTRNQRVVFRIVSWDFKE